jgi:PilZ domain-containing protein
MIVRVEWRLEGSLTRYRTTTRDISESGVLLDTLAPPAVGAPVALRLGARAIRLMGTVARGNSGSIAIRLTDPMDATRRRLRRYLRTAEGRRALAFT